MPAKERAIAGSSYFLAAEAAGAGAAAAGLASAFLVAEAAEAAGLAASAAYAPAANREATRTARILFMVKYLNEWLISAAPNETACP